MIFFDFDGTLLESNGAWADIDRTFLGRHGLAVPEGYVDYCAHHSFASLHAPTPDPKGIRDPSSTGPACCVAPGPDSGAGPS